MQNQRRLGRLNVELNRLQKNPPQGVSCHVRDEDDDNLEHLEAQILGPENTSFVGGVFKLSIRIPENYPFSPPEVSFKTKVYHPNIDAEGRICLSILKMPTKASDSGAWKATLNLSAVLTSIRHLLADPNPDDPLVADIAKEYLTSPLVFEQKAADWTRRWATEASAADEPASKKSKSESNSD